MFSIDTLAITIPNKILLWQLLLDRGLLPSSFSVVPPNLVGTPQSESVLTSLRLSIGRYHGQYHGGLIF